MFCANVINGTGNRPQFCRKTLEEIDDSEVPPTQLESFAKCYMLAWQNWLRSQDFGVCLKGEGSIMWSRMRDDPACAYDSTDAPRARLAELPGAPNGPFGSCTPAARADCCWLLMEGNLGAASLAYMCAAHASAPAQLEHAILQVSSDQIGTMFRSPDSRGHQR